MILQNEQLKEIYFGAYSFAETEDGYLQAFQHNQAQMDFFKATLDFWYDRSMASCAKTLEFSTTATEISFDYKIIWTGSQDSFELCIDGLIHDIVYLKDIPAKGTLKFTMEEGMKNVIIYLPADATALIRNFDTNAQVIPAPKGEKVLWLGDSITQGHGAFRSGETYVSVANRFLNYDVLNQGIGGYMYLKYSLIPMDSYKPDKIIVALGTNQYETESMELIEEYYETLTSIYSGTPILCITPLWRGDKPESLPTLINFTEKLKNIVAKYDNVKVIDGFQMVPHLPEYFTDNLHPNALGMEFYGRNLVNEIKRIEF